MTPSKLTSRSSSPSQKLSKAGFDVGDISDKPLGRRVDNTVAWQNAAMHSGRLAVVAPRVDFVAVNSNTQFFQKVPKQKDATVSLLGSQRVGYNHIATLVEIPFRLRVCGNETLHMFISNVDIVLHSFSPIASLSGEVLLSTLTELKF